MTGPTRRAFATGLIAATVIPAATSFASARSVDRSGRTEADKLTGLSLTQAAAGIRAGTTTSVALIQACLDRIAIFNPKINAFITVLSGRALAQAAERDREARANIFRGPLHGVPIAVKDNIDTAGIRTTAGSKVFDDRVPEHDAEVVRRLLAAGAVLIGKTNLDEFGFSLSYFGSVRNPWALDRDPQGSSSGNAAALTTSLVYGAVGTDTGGSCRQPAAYCSIVGLKPTYGLVSVRGVVPLNYSLDTCGPMARTVEDVALLLNQMTGYDQLDVASVQHPQEDYVKALQTPVSGLRIGVVRAPFFDHIDADTLLAIEASIKILQGLTKSVADVSFPSVGAFQGLNMNDIGADILAYQEEMFEASASRYALTMQLALQGLKDKMNASSTSASTRVSSYIRHRRELELMRRTVDDAFVDFDLIILPTQRIIPPKLNAVIAEWENDKPHNPNSLALDNTSPFNVFGLPAISVPCGFSRDGLPIGLQIAGPHFSEGKILALAQAYETATEWYKHRPYINSRSPISAI